MNEIAFYLIFQIASTLFTFHIIADIWKTSLVATYANFGKIEFHFKKKG